MEFDGSQYLRTMFDDRKKMFNTFQIIKLFTKQFSENETTQKLQESMCGHTQIYTCVCRCAHTHGHTYMTHTKPLTLIFFGLSAITVFHIW